MNKYIKKMKEKPQYVILFLFLIFVFGFLIFIKVNSERNGENVIAKGQIRLERGGKVVTINENGLVEYKSEKGVFYETWDPSRTGAFFRAMEQEARAYLSNPPSEVSENAYKVTLWLDGKIVVIYVDEDSEVFDNIEEIFEEFDNSGDGSISDYFDTEDGGANDDGGNSPSISTPTPVNSQDTVTPTDTPVGGNGGSGEQTVPDCDLYGSTVTKRTVISNTICNIEEN